MLLLTKAYPSCHSEAQSPRIEVNHVWSSQTETHPFADFRNDGARLEACISQRYIHPPFVFLFPTTRFSTSIHSPSLSKSFPLVNWNGAIKTKASDRWNLRQVNRPRWIPFLHSRSFDFYEFSINARGMRLLVSAPPRPYDERWLESRH